MNKEASFMDRISYLEIKQILGEFKEENPTEFKKALLSMEFIAADEITLNKMFLASLKHDIPLINTDFYNVFTKCCTTIGDDTND